MGRSYRSVVLLILLLAYALNFLDRQILSVGLESIKHDLHLSDTQLGVLTGLAFALFYSTVSIPIAAWADRGDRSMIVALSLLVLGITVAWCGRAATFTQLVVARIGTGIGEAGIIPPAHSLIATYYSRKERLRAMSIFLLGGPVTLAIGFLLGGWLIERSGWRAAFLWTALPLIVLSVIVRLVVRDPRKATVDSETSVPDSHAAVGRDSRSVWAPFVMLSRVRTFRHLLSAFSVEYLFGYGLVQWLPVFFIRVHGMRTGELGLWLALIWGVGNAIGTYLGGLLTNQLTVAAEVRQLRIMAGAAAAFVPIYAAVLLSARSNVALSIMFMGAAINGLSSAPAFSLLQSLSPETMRAKAVAYVFLLANLIGLGLGPLIVGAMSDAFTPRLGSNSLRLALLICTPGYWWVAAHYLAAARTVMADLARPLEAA